MGAAMRRIHVGNALSAFGLGFTVPFLYVYVAQVRDLGAVTAGLVLAAFAVAALVVLPFSGRAIDRRGPLPVLIAALLTAAVGAMSLGLSSSAPLVLLSAGALGAGQAVMQPALATMIVECSTPQTRTRAFAMQFFLQNLGLGVGGLIGGQLVKHERPSDFTLLFAIETAIFLLLIVVMVSARLPRSQRMAETAPQASGSIRDVFRNPVMLQLCVLGFVLFFACYGQFESGLSAYGVEAAGISPSTLGIALAANTGAIVLAQFAVLKFVERRRRSQVIAAVGLIWAVAWMAAGYAGLGHGSQAMATAAFISTYALFGIGETMLAPTVAPLVADLAPESMVGRYNSAFALVKQLALAVGPAVGGPMGATLHAPYIVTFLLFSLGITVLALRLGKRLTPAQNHPYAQKSRIVAQGAPEAVAPQHS
ncbi:MFS transporter [Streptomyces sp. G45]|uniref:MFS transporter n=1 Tax=Streptomyces sp. G45 TaxID=3406627 RepID=UPI003C206C01